jgi:hypothetical protein
MADVKMPRTFKVSRKAVDASRAARDPNLKAPEGCAIAVDRNGIEYKRWVETGSIEAIYREATTDGTQVVYVVGVKMRPGEPNQNKFGWFRMQVHPDIAEGREVASDIEAKYGWLTERALVALVSLIDVTGFTPKSGDGSLSGSLMDSLFPLKAQKSKSQLIGKSVSVKIVQTKNKPPHNAKKENQEAAELFLPPAPIPGLPSSLA